MDPNQFTWNKFCVPPGVVAVAGVAGVAAGTALGGAIFVAAAAAAPVPVGGAGA